MTKRIKLRTLLVGGFITLFFVVLVGRIYWVQVVNADYWADKARDVWSKSEKLIPTRGTISDRDGNVLAMDVLAYNLSVNPKVIHDLKLEDQIVSKLHTILGKSESDLLEIITAKNNNGEFYVNREVQQQGRQMDKEVMDKIDKYREELKKQTKELDVGIYLVEDKKRYYPKKNMASHIIGYVDKQGVPIMGLEKSLDKDLSGQEGEIIYERDGNGVILENGTVKFNPSVDGKNIKLTIDSDIQHYVEQALKEAYDEYHPKSITAIAVDPQTMEILGMANLPDFNPNEFWKAQQPDFYNSAVRALYEPGSTFKIVTLASAVQEGMFDPNETYMSGSIQVTKGKAPIRDIKRGGWGPITYLEGLKRSSNVAFVKLGFEKLKADRLMDYIKKFGFNEKTGIELPGEATGSISFNPSINSEVATATFGQGKVQVTPIQQVTAVAAVANGGKLMQPHLIKEVEDPVTSTSKVTDPKMVRQVISEKSSELVGGYLEQVVSDQKIGTGKNAYIEGYRIAGKTGTAQKVVNGVYSTDQYVVSFIGYAPVEKPRIAVYVVADAPENKLLGGGTVAAPVFKKIVLQSLRHMGVSPTLEPNKEKPAQKEVTVTLPDLTNLTLDQAKAELTARTLTPEVVGKGNKILQQIPKADSAVNPTQRVYLITENRSEIEIPNMSGLSLRDAMEICSLLQIKCITEGEGYVTSQMLAKLKGEKVLKLTLSPPAMPSSQNSSDESKQEETKTE
ncbi:PASTA domain-containing penicillin-binding protein [Paenibacillus nasutitermitis]|uniref:Penicillin-binding protein 2B n=1 Tax=Paenibacillus nasutitermitis TaxID=1652958 RepID=A0A917DUV4_9BACL|nr:PASTA domain-containing penicillin-binding protein [Paenibacillus nasutitermitis]GGD71064.1 penicillin-binding protein 2B [Paenibacillus nasutitermitis]